MKAIHVTHFGTADNMIYVDLEIPRVHPHQLLIRVKTTSVNFADIKSRYGKKGQNLPFIPGLEVAGIVENVGTAVTNFKVGQRVLAFPHHGSYAEYVVADENLSFVIPDTINFDIAGGCGVVSFLSYKLLADVARLEVGETVLIHSAAGGVGTTATQIAKALGAGKVIGTVGNESKFPIAYGAGADHVVNYGMAHFAKEIHEITDGKGVDIILDSVGGDITEHSFDCLAKYGRLVIFGNSSGRYSQLQTGDLHASCRSVLGYSFGTTRKERPETLKQVATQVFRLIEERKLDIKISNTFPLRDATLAHEVVESRKSTGKILLNMES